MGGRQSFSWRISPELYKEAKDGPIKQREKRWQYKDDRGCAKAWRCERTWNLLRYPSDLVGWNMACMLRFSTRWEISKSHSLKGLIQNSEGFCLVDQCGDEYLSKENDRSGFMLKTQNSVEKWMSLKWRLQVWHEEGTGARTRCRAVKHCYPSCSCFRTFVL